MIGWQEKKTDVTEQYKFAADFHVNPAEQVPAFLQSQINNLTKTA